jgi:hypothetical protein
MKPIDYLKAAGVGLAVMAVTIAASFPAVFVYAAFDKAGPHDQAYFNHTATFVAPWCSYVGGPVLFFLLNWLLARRRPARNALLFAAASFVFYLVIDGGSTVLFSMSLMEFASVTVLISSLAKLAAALAGAWLGSRSRALKAAA